MINRILIINLISASKWMEDSYIRCRNHTYVHGVMCKLLPKLNKI